MKYLPSKSLVLCLFFSLCILPTITPLVLGQARAVAISDSWWALDGEGYPYLTLDDGSTWTRKTKIANKKFVSIGAVTSTSAWALTEDGNTFYTSRGEPWETRPSIPDFNFVDISAGNAYLAWALTEDGNAYSYYEWENPTVAWEYKGKPAEERFVSISSNNLYHAWALADNGNLYEYDNDLNDWYFLTDVGEGDFVSIEGDHYGPSITFISGFALTRDGKVYRTIDEGNTWEYRGKVGDEVYVAVGTRNRYWAWVIAQNGNTYLTPGDGGATWEQKENIGLYSISVLGSGDYNGNGRSDVAVFRPEDGLWAIRGYSRLYFGASPTSPPFLAPDFSDASDSPSTLPPFIGRQKAQEAQKFALASRLRLGYGAQAGSDPCAGDYDGDGTADVAIYRPDTGLWAARGIGRLYFGNNASVSTPADYDGDGKCDVAVFNRDSGLWSIRGLTRAYYGRQNDLPVPGDYDGDGSAEIAVFRPSNGLWSIRGLTRVYFGARGDIPVPGIYRRYAIPRTQIAVFRLTLNALWAVRDFTRLYFGLGDDYPVPADYDGDGLDDIAVFRPSTGLWAGLNLTRIYLGGSDDLPVTR